MKHIVKEFDVYTFEELSEEAQQKAIKAERNSRQELDWDGWDVVFEDFKDKFAKIGIENADFNFSLGYCQGDYAKLVKGDLNLNKIVEGVKFKHNTKKLFLDYLENSLESGKVYLEWFYDYNGSYPRLCNYLQPIAEKLEKEINEKIEGLNSKLYRVLQYEYEVYLDDATIREVLSEDESRLYYKSGEFYDYVD